MPSDQALRQSPKFAEVLDYTSIDTFLDCPRRFYWFQRGVRPLSKPDYFTAGAAWQEALVVWYEGKGLDAAKAAILQRFATDALPFVGEKRSPSNLCALLDRYVVHFPEEPWTLLNGEIGFRLPLFEGLDLAGSMDATLEWPGYGYLVLENKTTAGWINDRWLEQWNLHKQPTTYIWALSQLKEGVWGCLMNGASLDIPKRATTERNLFIRGLQQRSADQLAEFEHSISRIWQDILFCTEHWEWPKLGRFCYGGYGLAPCLYRHLCSEDALVPLDEVYVSPELYTVEEEQWAPWERNGSTSE